MNKEELKELSPIQLVELAQDALKVIVKEHIGLFSMSDQVDIARAARAIVEINTFHYKG